MVHKTEKKEKRRRSTKYLHHIIIEGISFLRLRQMPHKFTQFSHVIMLREDYHTQNDKVKTQKTAQFTQSLCIKMFQIESVFE
jgi:hypothetical protein